MFWCCHTAGKSRRPFSAIGTCFMIPGLCFHHLYCGTRVYYSFEYSSPLLLTRGGSVLNLPSSRYGHSQGSPSEKGAHSWCVSMLHILTVRPGLRIDAQVRLHNYSSAYLLTVTSFMTDCTWLSHFSPYTRSVWIQSVRDQNHSVRPIPWRSRCAGPCCTQS